MELERQGASSWCREVVERNMVALVKLCIFDLDGTLIDTLQDLADSTNYALRKNGFPLRTLQEYRAFVSDGLPKLVERALGEYYRPELAPVLIADYNRYYQVHYKDHSQVYAGIQDLLQELRTQGVKLAVVSNKPDDLLQLVVNHMFPPHTFDMVQGKDARFPLKPDPAAVNHVLQEMAVKPAETIYVGDSGADVLTAHNAGIKVIGVAWGFREAVHLQEVGADYIADSPDDILSVVLERGNVKKL